MMVIERMAIMIIIAEDIRMASFNGINSCAKYING